MPTLLGKLTELDVATPGAGGSLLGMAVIGIKNMASIPALQWDRLRRHDQRGNLVGATVRWILENTAGNRFARGAVAGRRLQYRPGHTAKFSILAALPDLRTL